MIIICESFMTSDVTISSDLQIRHGCDGALRERSGPAGHVGRMSILRTMDLDRSVDIFKP